MIQTAADTQAIVIDEVFPHAPEIIWKALTTGALIARWMMDPIGFQPVVGNRFTFQTKPAGAWDGVIHCEVLEADPNARFAYAWRGGDSATWATARHSTRWSRSPSRRRMAGRACA